MKKKTYSKTSQAVESNDFVVRRHLIDLSRAHEHNWTFAIQMPKNADILTISPKSGKNLIIYTMQRTSDEDEMIIRRFLFMTTNNVFKFDHYEKAEYMASVLAFRHMWHVFELS